MQKYVILFLCLVCLAGTGCWLTEMKIDPETEITNAEDIAKKAQGAMTSVAPVVNTFVPGSGIIIGGISLLLGLIGTTTTALVKSHRKGGALAAVIKGVDLINDKETKVKIREVAGAVGIEPYLNKIVKKYYPTKSST